MPILTTVRTTLFRFSHRRLTFRSMSKRKLNDFAGFREVLNKSKNIVALTGAGISAESGIPVFRGAGGLWRLYKSADLATPQAFRANPALVWEFYAYRRTVAFNAQPNSAHRALAEYEKLCKREGRTLSVITQNVDGLHRRAGSENVIELHGALHRVICTNKSCRKIEDNYEDPICEALRERGWGMINAGLGKAIQRLIPVSVLSRDPYARDEDLPIIDKKSLPKCKHCNTLVRPYIVWFGENLDPNVMMQSKNLIETCDLCLVIGTSSVVYPAAMFAPLAAERGVPVAEFNIEEEPASDLFSYHFPGKCGTTLPKALNIDL